jgi:shikimate kinase
VDKIFFIGLPGSGKSTFGKLLSERLKISFCDLDFEIEREIGKSISSIFETDGENVFRKLEQKALLTQIHQEGKTVISCGGGTPCFFDNMQVMNAEGITIFLDVPINTIVKRIEKNAHRPLLRDQHPKELLIKLSKERSVYYHQAQIIIDDWNFPEDKMVEELTYKLENETK